MRFPPPTRRRIQQLLDRLAEEFVQSGYRHRASGAPDSVVARPISVRSLPAATTRPTNTTCLARPRSAALGRGAGRFAQRGPGNGRRLRRRRPAGSQAIELAPNRFADPHVNAAISHSRPRQPQIAVRLRPDERRPRSGNRCYSDEPCRRFSKRFAAAGWLGCWPKTASNEEIVEEFYLATLARQPDAAERDFTLASRRIGAATVPRH